MYLRKRKKHAGKAQDRDTLRFFLFFVFLFYYFPFAVFKNYIFLKNWIIVYRIVLVSAKHQLESAIVEKSRESS